ncbi:transcriptional regulator [Acetobacter ascendens]|uniref:transcriptional regulator n=1 Tax=Acetobacter ascendens TaxID=481146 RepID=UPI000B3ED0A2
MSIVERAIKAAGGASELSKKCGLHRTSVLFWRRLGHIPHRHVATAEAATGIPREELRPDLFKRTPAQEAAR